MNNETYLDFCFIRESVGNFSIEINDMLKQLFSGVKLDWYLEEKTIDNAEMVVVEVKGMSNWRSEEETLQFLEQHGTTEFWQYLQGYKMFIYPATMRGCNSCGTH
ncbi:hypothetical protein HHO41_16945 [Bacillus sp. DNRA2]|uniref:hypothetical protein n=1 Tax=Bacillus sp. DNRA2 TaxID=2723053 RepID=UPI00145EB2A1|nr:hypothetical protein [Bacillus sp. DNRA2]NMD71989.1 hypothetical protein [Bacillus sp. DNRA2]